MHDPWELENRLYDQGYQAVCGVDEAGAGPLAGPVYAAAVILPRGLTLPYLNDSKKVTPRRREILFDQIREQAIAYAIAWADEKEIDAINILNARMLAMDRAIKMLNPAADFALIDGNRNQGIELQNEMVVHGDARSASIMRPRLWSRGTPTAPPSRRPPFWPRSAETGSWWSWRSSTPNTPLRSTRATPLSSTTNCCASMAPVPSTARPS